MAENFLQIIEKRLGSSDYSGDQFGGASGATGGGLPSASPRNFLFATGIECSYPTIQQDGKTIRRDLLEECGHTKHWRRDLELVRELGLRVLRYGLPYYAIQTGPDTYDWSFADQVMNEMKRLEITPILDLMHFGVPDFIGDYQNPELPLHFANFCEQVAQRYPWVRYYTPVNEIYVTARFSGKDGVWNESLKTDKGFVTALKHCVAASILGNHAIARHRPDCIIVQSESAEYLHEARAVPTPEVTLHNKLRFLSLDLLYAHVPDADICLYMMDNGLEREEFAWFMKGEPPGYQVMGNDYYGRNEGILTPSGMMLEAEDVFGWYSITREYFDRYKKPVMHTETNHFDPQEAPKWLWKQWLNVLRMRADGVPVLGFTWYSLTDQVDWDSGLAKKLGIVNKCGLYDLKRKPRPVAAAYRELLQEFGQITVVPHGEMFEITDRPAQLKVEV